MATAPRTPGKEFHVLAPGFLPCISVESSCPPPQPTQHPGVMGNKTACGDTRRFGGCLACHSWVWWGRRGDINYWGSTAKPVMYQQSCVQPLQLSGPVLDVRTNSGLPHLRELTLLPTHLLGKPFRMPSPNHPFLRALVLGQHMFFSVLYCMMENRMLSPKIRSKARISPPTTFTDSCTGDSSQCNQVRKRNIRHSD